MNWIASIYNAHPTLVPMVAYYIAVAFVGSLPAPTASASQVYLFIFKFSNTLAANLVRAYASKVEASPNFQAAVTKQNVADGTTPIALQGGVPVPPIANP